MSDSPVIVRQAVREDVPALVELNSLAYPSMAEEDIIYQQSHMEKHQEVFPEGQLVAVIDGEMVGACATLIVEMGPNPLRHHTWAGITDSGFFTNHNPQGDTLYGAAD